MSEVDCLPIETEVALLRAEIVALGDKNASLQAENTGLQVKYAEVKTDNKWLMRALWVLFAAVLMLIAALVLEKMPGKEKSGEKKPNAGPTSLKLLFRLLNDLFEQEEVARFVRLHLGASGTAVIDGLGQPTSADDFFLKIVIALHQHGLVGELLFDALLEVRPNQRDYILKIQAACSIGVDDEGLTAGSAESAIARGTGRA